ncbi:MAG: DNA-methyltransferase [Actinomycetota bacterium]
MTERREPTQTSRFGVSRRENHDASSFYARFRPPDLSPDSRVSPHKSIDRIIVGDARSMPDVPDGSVALVVTSPPYFAGKEYEEALGEGGIPATYLEYLQMLEDVFAECVRTLEPGGRIAVNVANLGRKPYRSLSSDVIGILQDKLGLLLRGEVIWQKARGSAGSCAWGSFQRPANPVLRDLTERIVVASKGRFDRALTARERHRQRLPSDASLWRDEFMEATTDVWEMPPESATRVGHPAPFPTSLPERLIHLYTYLGDLVLDPFVGSGTTAVAAVRTERHYVGYDVDATYAQRARARVEEEVRRLAAGVADRECPPYVLPAVAGPVGTSEDASERAMREGRAARDVAEALLRGSGFRSLESKVKFPAGIEVTFRARDARGGRWLFDVVGGFTSHRPGLKRSDAFWKAVGKAAVLQGLAPRTPLVLLTPDAPERGSPGDAALAVVTGAGKPIRAVIRMTAEEDRALLRSLAAGTPPR